MAVAHNIAALITAPCSEEPTTSIVEQRNTDEPETARQKSILVNIPLTSKDGCLARSEPNLDELSSPSIGQGSPVASSSPEDTDEEEETMPHNETGKRTTMERYRKFSTDYHKDFMKIIGLCRAVHPRSSEDKEHFDSIISKLREWNITLAEMDDLIAKRKVETWFTDAMEMILQVVVRNFEANEEIHEANKFKEKLGELFERETVKAKTRLTENTQTEAKPKYGLETEFSTANMPKLTTWDKHNDESEDEEEGKTQDQKVKLGTIRVRICNVEDCPYIQKASSGSNMAAHYRRYHGTKEHIMGLVSGKCTYQRIPRTEFYARHKMWREKSTLIRKGLKLRPGYKPGSGPDHNYQQTEQ